MFDSSLLRTTVTIAIVFALQARDTPAADPSHATVLGVQDTRFTLNDRPTFLLGMSYYGALSAPEDFIRRDLDDLRAHGFNWLRVWATWESSGENVSAVDSRGLPREPYLQRLKSFVAECDRRGFVVDVTLSRGKRTSRSPAGVHLPDVVAHRQAVRTIVEAMKPHRNWYLDLANERDVGDERFVSVDELKTLREVARELEPTLLVTASFGGHDLSRGDVRESLTKAGLDFLSVHRPRHPQSPQQTEARTREVLAMAAKLGRAVPVHHQEPFRRGYANWEPASTDFLTDLRGAVAGGAAGWCFHNGSQRTTPDKSPHRSFDLRHQRLFDQLDAEERTFLHAAKSALELSR